MKLITVTHYQVYFKLMTFLVLIKLDCRKTMVTWELFLHYALPSVSNHI